MKRIFFVMLVMAGLGGAFFASAAGLIPCNGPDCTPCDLLTLTKNIVNWIIMTSIVIAAGLFAYGAFRIMIAMDKPAAVQEGKGIIYTTMIGLLIIFGAWIIVGTFLQIITQSSSKLPWNEIECKAERPLANTSGISSSFTSGTTLSEIEARNQLAQNGITVNKQPCPAGGSFQTTSGGCTSLDGVKAATIQGAIRLKNACGCPLEVTGGTESGHASGATSHGTGDKLDFRPNPALDEYIKKNYQYAGVRSDGAQQYTAPDGTKMAREDDHWDVTF